MLHCDLGVEGHNFFQTICCKCKYFSHEFQSWKPCWGAPSWRLDFWPCRFEAPGHGCSWRPPRRLSTAVTLQPRLRLGMPPSAAAFRLRRFPGDVGRQRRGRGREMTKVGQLSSIPVQPTNERWMFWTQHLQICSMQKNPQTHSTSFSASFLLVQMTLSAMKHFTITCVSN